MVTIISFVCFLPMDAPASTPPAVMRLTPPALRRSNYISPDDQRLRLIFTDAEFDIISKKHNSQLVKSWIYFYRLCLKDPLVFALVK